MASKMYTEVDENTDDPIKITNFIVGDHHLINAEIVDFGYILDSEENADDPSETVDKVSSEKRSPAPVRFNNTVSNEAPLSICRPVHVRLVDCDKNPWYYKKYTTQIVTRLGNYENIEEINNVDGKKDNVEDFYPSIDEKKASHAFSEKVKSAGHLKSDKTNAKDIALTKKLEIQNNVELQNAIKQKDITKIDYKKNRGLIGLKIVSKKIIGKKDHAVKTLTKLNEGEKEAAISCESRRKLVDSTLRYISTSVSQYVDSKDGGERFNTLCIEDNNASSQCHINMDKSKLIQNHSNSVKCILNVKSSKILKNIINSKESEKISEIDKQCYFFCLNVEKDKMSGTKCQVSKLTSDNISEHLIVKKKANTKENKRNKVSKPMPKSKKRKTYEEYRTKCTETTEKTNDIGNIHKKAKNNETPASLTLQHTSVTEKLDLNKTCAKLKVGLSIPKYQGTRDTYNESITRGINSTDNLKEKIGDDPIQGERERDNRISLNTENTEDTKVKLINHDNNEHPVLIDKDKTEQILDVNKLAKHYIINNKIVRNNIQSNTTDTNKPNMPIKQQETFQNSNDSKKIERLVNLNSLDKLSYFRTNNNYVTVKGKACNSSVNGTKFSKHPPELSENANDLQQFPKRSVVCETNGNDALRKLNQSNIYINGPYLHDLYPKESNQASAIVIRPIQPTRYNVVDNLVRLPVHTHVSNRPLLQRTAPTFPRQMFPSIRPHVPAQLPAMNPTLYGHSYNFIPSPFHNEEAFRNVLNTSGLHSPMYVNPNPYWGFAPPPPPPPPPQHEDTSVIGVNNGGVIKKINISTVSPEGNKVDIIDSQYGIIELKNTNTNVPDFEPVTTRMEMLNELDRTIMEHSPVKSDLKETICAENITYLPIPGVLSKKSKLDVLRVAKPLKDESDSIGMLSEKLTHVPRVDEPVSSQNGFTGPPSNFFSYDPHVAEQLAGCNSVTGPLLQEITQGARVKKSLTGQNDVKKLSRKQVLAGKGYSPPILPLPIFHKILSQVQAPRKFGTDPRLTKKPIYASNALDKHSKVIYFKKECGKEEQKKISIEEYKKRVHRNAKNGHIAKRISKTLSHNKEKQNTHNFKMKPRKMDWNGYLPDTGYKNVDKDLGYDSDTTVKL